MSLYKQVIVVRKDLQLSKGKMAAQVAHASVAATVKSHKDDVQKWLDQGMKKSVLKVEDLKELRKIKQEAEDAGLVSELITDAGRTHLEPGTVTCLGIGPDEEKKIDRVTGHLHLVS